MEGHDPLLEFCLAAWQNEEAFRIEDAYKWLFQATMGGEHAITNEEGVRRWMDEEWESLGPPKLNEPLIVVLRPDGALLRVNLRPYRAAGGSKERLLEAFIDSAELFVPDREAFRFEWHGLGRLLHFGPQNWFSYLDWSRLEAETGPGYPAIDHSSENLKVADPAYRVVSERFAGEIAAGP